MRSKTLLVQLHLPIFDCLRQVLEEAALLLTMHRDHQILALRFVQTFQELGSHPDNLDSVILPRVRLELLGGSVLVRAQETHVVSWWPAATARVHLLGAVIEVRVLSANALRALKPVLRTLNEERVSLLRASHSDRVERRLRFFARQCTNTRVSLYISSRAFARKQATDALVWHPAAGLFNLGSLSHQGNSEDFVVLISIARNRLATRRTQLTVLLNPVSRLTDLRRQLDLRPLLCKRHGGYLC